MKRGGAGVKPASGGEANDIDEARHGKVSGESESIELHLEQVPGSPAQPSMLWRRGKVNRLPFQNQTADRPTQTPMVYGVTNNRHTLRPSNEINGR